MHTFAKVVKMKRVLLIEDDLKFGHLLKKSIEQASYLVDFVSSAGELQRVIEGAEKYDLMVMDRLFGHLDTKSEISGLRKKWPSIPILVISAINTPTERAEMINEGVDDYLGKPFHTEEFLARLGSLARRIVEKQNDSRIIGNAVLDLINRRISVGSLFQDLSQKEFLILKVLSERKKVYSRHELLEIVWGNMNLAETNLVEATVTNLRRRLASISCGFQIKNMRNVGYWIED